MTTKKERSKISCEHKYFLKNQYPTMGKYDIPIIRREDIDLKNLSLLPCTKAKRLDFNNHHKGIHFFVHDYRFENTYDRPDIAFKKYENYRFLLSPDFSLYADMQMFQQIGNVGKNRWVGAHWQSKGKIVIPTVSWSTEESFEFCFNGIEKGSIVAVSTVGCRRMKESFLKGYNEMLRVIEPTNIICYGKPFKNMDGSILYIPYEEYHNHKPAI